MKKRAPRKRKPHIEILEGVVSWHVAIIAANGETLMHSEDYANKSNAQCAAQKLAVELGVKIV